MDLQTIFKSIAEKLAIDFRYMSSEIEHKASKGRVREIELVEQFLRKYLPATIGISHGEIATTTGEVSNECDVIIYESRTCPILLDKSGYQIFPAECVYGVLEVKSLLNNHELEDAFAKISKVKRFPKMAFEPQAGAIINTTNLYDKEWSYFPTVGFVFAYDSIDLLTLRNQLGSLQKDLPLNERIDSVWVLNKGMIVNWDDSTSKINHTPNSKTRMRAVVSENPLLLMTIHLQQLFQAGWMPKFKIQEYLQNVNYGNFLEG
jgi:hypothetical protein